MNAQAVLPISASNLTMVRNGRSVLNVKSISVGQAPCSGIIGPNGAGKSLLLRTLGGLIVPDSGSVSWAGQPALVPGRSLSAPEKVWRLSVGFVTQRPALLARSAKHNLEYALKVRGVSASAARTRTLAVLEECGLSAIVNTPAHRLSGGEQQRLALARALALEPAILLLDEPTASVDPISTAPIEAMLKRAIESGCRVVIVSHDLNQIKRLADEVLLMHKGEVVEQQPVSTFFDAPKSSTARKWLAGELLI